jgi:hypothetical protein
VCSAQPQRAVNRANIHTAVFPHKTSNATRLQTYIPSRTRQGRTEERDITATKMGKSEMRILNFPKPAASPSRYRRILVTLLFVLCIPIFFYQLVPSFTHASDAFIADLATRIRSQASFCTKDVGDAQCCALYLTAAPCVDECRKQHVNRVTYKLTLEYEECADRCLGEYNGACGRAEG